MGQAHGGGIVDADVEQRAHCAPGHADNAAQQHPFEQCFHIKPHMGKLIPQSPHL